MTLQISLTPEAEVQLRDRAAESGEDLPAFASRLLSEVLSKPSLNEVLAPLRREVEQSGLSEDDLSKLLEKAKHEMRASRSQVGQ